MKRKRTATKPAETPVRSTKAKQAPVQTNKQPTHSQRSESQPIPGPSNAPQASTGKRRMRTSNVDSVMNSVAAPSIPPSCDPPASVPPIPPTHDTPWMEDDNDHTDSDHELSNYEDLDDVIQQHSEDIMGGGEIQATGTGYGRNSHSGARQHSSSALNACIKSLLTQSLSKSSVINYRNAFKHYRHFHATTYPHCPLLPITELQLAQFIASQSLAKMKPSSISSMVSALSYVHKIRKLPNPMESFAIKKMLSGLRKRSVPDKRYPITVSLLHRLVSSVQESLSSQEALLFKAMFLLAFYALLRIGEMASTRTGSKNMLMRKQITFHHKRSQLHSMTIRFLHFKHSNGRSESLKLRRMGKGAFCPVLSLHKYITHSPFPNGPLFVNDKGKPITANSFRSVLRFAIESSGLDPARFTTHSFRIGGATYAKQLHSTSTKIKKLGRWTSGAFRKYIRPTACQINF